MPVYHVTLGGEGFLVDPLGYRVRAQALPTGPLPDPEPLAPRPAFERVQRQADFSAGEGREGGWRAGSSVVAGADGSLTLGLLLADCGAGAVFGQGARCFAVFRGRLYAGLDGSPGQVWSSADGTAWTLAFTTSKPGVRALAVYRDALYVGNGGDGAVQKWDGTTLTTAWTNADTSSIEALCVGWFSGSARLFVGNCGTSGLGAWLQSFDGTAQGTIAFLDEPRIEALAIGPDGRLYVSASEPTGQPRGALYSYGGTASGFTLERAFPEGYAAAATTLGKRLLLGWSDGRPRTWEPGSDTLDELAFPLGLEAGAGPLRALALHAGAVWLGRRDTSGAVGLRRYDPLAGAWSREAAAGVTGDEVQALAVFGGALYLGVKQAAGGARIYRASLAASSGEAELYPFDGGLPEVDKLFRTLRLRHAALPAGASVAVDWRPEPPGSAAWQLLGSSATGGAEEATFSLPSSASGRAIGLRLRLTRGPGSGDVPTLREVVVRVVPTPPLKREWRFPVLLEGDAARPLARLDNSPEPRDARQMAQALWTLRAQPGPLTFVDLEGATRQVWFRDLEETPAKTLSLDPTKPWTTAQVTLVEA